MEWNGSAWTEGATDVNTATRQGGGGTGGQPAAALMLEVDTTGPAATDRSMERYSLGQKQDDLNTGANQTASRDFWHSRQFIQI